MHADISTASVCTRRRPGDCPQNLISSAVYLNMCMLENCSRRKNCIEYPEAHDIPSSANMHLPYEDLCPKLATVTNCNIIRQIQMKSKLHANKTPCCIVPVLSMSKARPIQLNITNDSAERLQKA
jgi:hypothetical protein